MQPREAIDRLRWTEQSLNAILQQLLALEAQLNAFLLSPLALVEEERALADAICGQLDALKQESVVLQAQFARTRTRRGRPSAGPPGGAARLGRRRRRARER